MMDFSRSKVRFLITVCLVAFALGAAFSYLWARHGRHTPRLIKQGKQQTPPRPEGRAAYGPPARLGALEDTDVKESSGVAASRTNAGLFWTHNDSGDGPYLYAFDRGGRKRGVWRVAGAKARDWEDMAVGPGPEHGRSYLYIGDIGDNDYERNHVVIYRVPEPLITAADAAASRREPRETEAAEAIRVRYPDGARNAETLLVQPQTGDIYIVAKSLDPAAGVYKLAAPISASKTHTLVRVGEVRAPGAAFGGLFTGGAVSPDGTRVLLCDYVRAYEFVLPAGSAFDAIWKQAPLAVELGEREQGEAVCYDPTGDSILATSEGRRTALVEVRRAARPEARP